MQATEITIGQWFEELDRYAGAIPLEVLNAGLKRLRVDFSAFEPFAQFSKERYRRNLMHAGPGYHALVLCWQNGQASPIHDHRGSACAVLVLRGAATETVFDMTEEGRIFERVTRKLPEGYVCATQDLDIHRLANLEPDGGDLITLHLYSPPLLVMGQYSLADSSMSDFRDEVHEFAEGAGI